MRVLPRTQNTINSAWLVRVLASSRRCHHCLECGARMFVQGRSGLCPVCRDRRQRREHELGRIVEEQSVVAVHDWI